MQEASFQAEGNRIAIAVMLLLTEVNSLFGIGSLMYFSIVRHLHFSDSVLFLHNSRVYYEFHIEMSEVSSFPGPPNHYLTFASGPTDMQPPDISELGATYRMFGQIVQNPNMPENANLPPPAIDRDVIMYDRSNGLKNEIIRLIDSLPDSVMAVLDAVENKPNESSSQIRDFDNRIKSLFHALEILRNVEARDLLLKLTSQEIEKRERLNENCRQIVQNALESLNS